MLSTMDTNSLSVNLSNNLSLFVVVDWLHNSMINWMHGCMLSSFHMSIGLGIGSRLSWNHTGGTWFVVVNGLHNSMINWMHGCVLSSFHMGLGLGILSRLSLNHSGVSLHVRCLHWFWTHMSNVTCRGSVESGTTKLSSKS